MKICNSKLKAFFKRTGKVQDVSWDDNVLKPIRTKTIQPDVRLSFNETFINIHNQINNGRHTN